MEILETNSALQFYGMPTNTRFVYLDTDAFRHLGTAFVTGHLSEELGDRIVLSPITFLELYSQLTLPGSEGEKTWSIVKALPNYVNRQNVSLLPWWTAAASGVLEKVDEDLAKEIQEALNVCLNSKSFDEIHDDAGKLKDMLDSEREKQRSNFEELMRLYKECVKDRAKFKEVCAGAIANRVGVEINNGSLAKILDDLSAHIEYQEERVKLAVNDANYRPRINDYFDSLQLVYLADPKLHFCTCDRGYAKRIKTSPQLTRIHTTTIGKLTDRERAEKLLACIVR